jgi:hypothetical protein
MDGYTELTIRPGYFCRALLAVAVWVLERIRG